MIVTTNIKTPHACLEKAQQVAKQLAIPFIIRKKQTINTLVRQYGKVIVVYVDRIEYYDKEQHFFFHPNTALLRFKQGNDPLVSLLPKQPVNILDATMGMAGDSILMCAAGHHVTSLESNPIIHLIVSDGLKNYDAEQAVINTAMKTIKTVCCEALTFLKKQPSKSFDVIYFDPMFHKTIEASHNLNGIRHLANYAPLTKELLEEAKRVASLKIILKAHYLDKTFEKLGLMRMTRLNTKFHYGFIDLSKQ